MKLTEKQFLRGLPTLTGKVGLGTNQRLYLCIGDRCWGRGVTADEAVKNAKHNRVGRDAFPMVLYDIRADTTVDDMGCLCYYPEDSEHVGEPYIRLGGFYRGVVN